jgi:hypothetical protein
MDQNKIDSLLKRIIVEKTKRLSQLNGLSDYNQKDDLVSELSLEIGEDLALCVLADIDLSIKLKVLTP